MARTIVDLAAMFKVVAGWDDTDPMSAPVPAGPGAAVAGLGVGYFEDDGRTPVTRETREAVRAAARAVAEAGYRVEPFLPEGLERARELWTVFFCEAGLMLLKDPLKGLEIELPILNRARGGPVPMVGPSTTGSNSRQEHTLDRPSHVTSILTL